MSDEDSQRLFNTNFLGVVYGSLEMGCHQRDEPPRSCAGTLYKSGQAGCIRGRENENAADMGEVKESNLRSSG